MALKAKAWAMEKGAYCQINIKLAKNLGEIYKADHSLIVEAYGDESFRLSGRKINYMTMPVPVSEAGNFYMLISKEVSGECEVSVAVNVISLLK